MKKAINELHIKLDPMVLDHLVDACKECTDKEEIRDLTECFLEDAGFTDMEKFMEYFKHEESSIGMDKLKLLDTEIQSSKQV